MTERSVAPRTITGGLGPGAARLRILLVEDDEGDAFLVRELLLDAGSDIDLVRVRSLAEATGAIGADVDCVLLDLGLPDATGLDGLRSVLELSPNIAVLVLTGLADEHRGADGGTQASSRSFTVQRSRRSIPRRTASRPNGTSSARNIIVLFTFPPLLCPVEERRNLLRALEYRFRERAS